MDTIPREAGAQLMDCAMDLDSRQKFLPDSAPWAAKAKQNSVVSSHCPRVCYKITFEIHFIIKLQIIALFKKIFDGFVSGFVPQILENHGSKGTSQPCPRCVAGESVSVGICFLGQKTGTCSPVLDHKT